MDQFYLQVYGIKTDDPDKYVGLLNYNKLGGQLDTQIDKARKVLRFV